MVPLLEASSDEWSYGTVFGFVVGAVAGVSLIAVVVKCACCGKHRPMMETSLLYDVRDKDVPPPQDLFQETSQKEDVVEKAASVKTVNSAVVESGDQGSQRSRTLVIKAASPSVAEIERASRTAILLTRQVPKRRKKKSKHCRHKKPQKPIAFGADDDVTTPPSGTRFMLSDSPSGSSTTLVAEFPTVPEVFKPSAPRYLHVDAAPYPPRDFKIWRSKAEC